MNNTQGDVACLMYSLARVDNMSLYYRDILSWGRRQNEFRFAFVFAKAKECCCVLGPFPTAVCESFALWAKSLRCRMVVAQLCYSHGLSCTTYLSYLQQSALCVIVLPDLLVLCMNNLRYLSCTCVQDPNVQNCFNTVFSVGDGLATIVGLIYGL